LLYNKGLMKKNRELDGPLVKVDMFQVQGFSE
jgi:hypothetical protein